MADFLTSIESEWQDAVLRWKSAVADFQSAIEAHYALRDKAAALGPDELQQWQDQLDYALKVQTAIQMLQETLASTSSWAKSALGLGTMRNMMGQMGVIPLIPVAVIIASISTITAVIYSLYSYNSELQRKWQYINDNQLDPTQASNVLQASSPLPFVGDVKQIAGFIVVGAIVFFLAPLLLKGRK